jgi:hypothetical protein
MWESKLWFLVGFDCYFKQKNAKESQKWLESGLHQIFELCFVYLVNTEQFLATCHEVVWDAITYK